MHIPIPVTALLGGVGDVLRPHRLYADLHPAAAPVHYPLRNIDAVSTSSLVWALIGIVISASLLAFAALRAGRDPRPRDGLIKPRPVQYRAATAGTERHPAPDPPTIPTAIRLGANLRWP